jgi:FkbM family methyltransferase
MLNNPRLSMPYGRDGIITLDYRDWLQSSILRTGAYEPEVWDALCADLGRDEVFWDVGAHIGTFSVLACRDTRFKMIHAFEPEPDTYRVLCAHLRLNPGVQRTAHRLALSSQREERALSSGPQLNTGLSSFVSDARLTKRTSMVKCATADDMVYEQRLTPPTVMKVDVEGWELEVLRGATRLLSEAPPRVIVLEASAEAPPCTGDEGLGDFLASYNYSTEPISRPDGHREPRENYVARLKQ